MRMLTENRDSLEAANRKIARYVELVDKHIITSSTNRFGRITEVSEAFCKISKYSKYELIGRSHNIVRHPDMPASLYEDMWQTISSGKYWQGEIKNRAKDGSAYWVDVNIEPIFSENDEILGYTAIRQDITDKKRIEEISVTDSLTGLYNRMRLDQEVAAEIDRANRYATTYSIILFDLDHFKRINDSCGHLVGDSVLEEIGRIMQERVRQVDLAGRWGGEEFMVICPGVNMTGANTLAEDLRQAIASHNFQTGEKVTASFGVAEYLPNESNIEMVNRVDQALYQAKTSGRNLVYCARANVDIGIA
jgi:diguanylate cyclase (GGDEF)-like protein/PAS domain S-box-containing protein